jgi:ABC-type phosphate transport system substrate-binding protein
MRLLLIAISLLWMNPGLAAESQGAIVVITNKDVQEKSITIGALRSIFGMRLKSWSNDEPVRVFVFSDYHPLHIEFSKKVLGVFPHQLRSSWDRLVFSGTGQAPSYIRNEAEMLNFVENTPGAIGYITRSHEHGQVKELPVIKD